MPKDSSAIVLARHSSARTSERLASEASGPLVWRAFGLAALCAALMFCFLALRGRSLSLLDGTEKIGPALPPKAAMVTPAEAKASAETVPAPQPVPLLEQPDRTVTQFILAESPDFQRLGPVRLKLTSVDAAHGSYNLLLVAKGHSFDKTNIKLNEPVTLPPAGTKAASQIVVNAIVADGVQGYLSEPNGVEANYSGSSHRRRHRRHRWYRSKPKSGAHTG
jgi:hypothetical protein